MTMPRGRTPRNVPAAPATTPVAAPRLPSRRLPPHPVRQDPTLVQTGYQDDTGRWWAVMVPPGREADAGMGIVVGPPDLADVLDWPELLAVRLHNELYHRGLLTAADLRTRATEIEAAVRAACRMDVQAIMAAYRR